MKPTWLIERGVYRNDAARVKDEVERQGMQCAEVDYFPGRKTPDDLRGCPALPDNACVVLWGTLPLMQQLQIQHTWIPGGWCHLQNLDCSTYYRQFGPWLLNNQHAMLTGVEATRQEQQLFEQFGRDELFVRPSGVHKLFTGKVVYRDDFRDAIAPARYDPLTLVVVAPPQEIAREWRLIIVGDVVVAASQYRDQGAISIATGCPEEVARFAAEILNSVRWRPDRAFMMDVCESDGRLHILELNSFSCSAWYACDVAAVVRAASEAAQAEWTARQALK